MSYKNVFDICRDMSATCLRRDIFLEKTQMSVFRHVQLRHELIQYSTVLYCTDKIE